MAYLVPTSAPSEHSAKVLGDDVSFVTAIQVKNPRHRQENHAFHVGIHADTRERFMPFRVAYMYGFTS